MNNSKITVEHIIAKIDNDFNPDNSDWIPRVAAWCTDAMSQLKVLNTVEKAVKYNVKDRIVRGHGCFDNIIKVIDENNCEVKRAEDSLEWCNSCSSPTGVKLNQIIINIVILMVVKLVKYYIILMLLKMLFLVNM